MHDALEHGALAIAIDMARVTFMDSTAIAWSEHGGNARPRIPLGVANPSPPVERVFALAGMDRVFGPTPPAPRS